MSVVSGFCSNCQRNVYVSQSDSLTCPVCASPLLVTEPDNNQRVVRIASNETLFREVNERIERAVDDSGAPRDEVTGFVCECGAPDCTETINLTPEAYEAIRSDAALFAVLPGHVEPEAERVVKDHGAYLVVEKVGPGRVIAEERDTRP